MKKIILFCVAIALIYSVNTLYRNENQMNSPSKECEEVIRLGNQHLKMIEKINPEEYKLIKVQNMIIHGSNYIGPDIWHLTYKVKRIIPRGKGGEIFIEVNLKENAVKILGYGE